jgi:hypothetical protein
VILSQTGDPGAPETTYAQPFGGGPSRELNYIIGVRGYFGLLEDLSPKAWLSMSGSVTVSENHPDSGAIFGRDGSITSLGSVFISRFEEAS